MIGLMLAAFFFGFLVLWNDVLLYNAAYLSFRLLFFWYFFVSLPRFVVFLVILWKIAFKGKNQVLNFAESKLGRIFFLPSWVLIGGVGGVKFSILPNMLFLLGSFLVQSGIEIPVFIDESVEYGYGKIILGGIFLLLGVSIKDGLIITRAFFNKTRRIEQ